MKLNDTINVLNVDFKNWMFEFEVPARVKLQ